MSPSECREAFAARFGRECQSLARAPGRVNLIGEHVDYNDGFVLPIATQHCSLVAAAARTDDTQCVWSAALQDQARWQGDLTPEDLHGRLSRDVPRWARYFVGVASLLRSRGARLGGFDLLVESDVPVGTGLSSSASIVVASALALAFLSGEPLEARELLELARAVEHEFAGVPCGVMDPAAVLLGRANCATLLDCRALSAEYIPLSDARVLVVDSGERHELADGEYAARRRQCQSGREHFPRRSPRVRARRDGAHASVRAQASELDPLVAARCMHVTGEIERTLAAAEALRRGRLEEFGRHMLDSHRSLRDQFEVSTPLLDRLVELLAGLPGVFGARLTGAGFGGCVVALAREAALGAVQSRIERLAAELQAQGRAPPRLLLTQASAGAAVLG